MEAVIYTAAWLEFTNSDCLVDRASGMVH